MIISFVSNAEIAELQFWAPKCWFWNLRSPFYRVISHDVISLILWVILIGSCVIKSIVLILLLVNAYYHWYFLFISSLTGVLFPVGQMILNCHFWHWWSSDQLVSYCFWFDDHIILTGGYFEWFWWPRIVTSDVESHQIIWWPFVF